MLTDVKFLLLDYISNCFWTSEEKLLCSTHSKKRKFKISKQKEFLILKLNIIWISQCYKQCLKVIKNNCNNNNNNIAAKYKITKCTLTAYNE